MKYLGFALLVLSGYVMAEEVYYCSDVHRGANGFWNNDEARQYEPQYEPQLFTESKFKMKVQDDGNIVIENSAMKSGRDLYLCSTPYQGQYKNKKSCVEKFNSGYYFNFNQDNGRYIWFKGLGYVFHDGDDVITQIGTCTKF